MVINKKKRQTCLGIIQDIHDHIQKKKIQTRFRTHRARAHTHSVHLVCDGDVQSRGPRRANTARVKRPWSACR